MTNQQPKRRSGNTPADYVEVLSGPEDGKVFELRGDLATIGREADNDICVPLELSISRHHARLVKDDDHYRLEVLNDARNGGRAGAQSLDPGQTAILQRPGVFELGNVSFLLGGGAGWQG
jgi:pSer/pThr/pTyr-binding forkhead associated (FHA) protein